MPTPIAEKGSIRLRTRCVLWHAPGMVVPPNLGSSLTARPVDVVACDNPYTALGALCCGASGEASRPTLLVLIEPATLALAARVLVLAEQYVPHAARWAYESAAEVKLRAVTPALVANLNRAVPVPLPTVITTRSGAAAPAGVGGVGGVGGAPNGVHGEMGKSIPTLRDPPAQKLPSSALKDEGLLSVGLSAEELAMLLAEAPENSGSTPVAPPSRQVPPSSPGASR